MRVMLRLTDMICSFPGRRDYREQLYLERGMFRKGECECPARRRGGARRRSSTSLNLGRFPDCSELQGSKCQPSADASGYGWGMPAAHPRPATISDVAAQAGVSKAAASQALSGKGRISPATRDRIAEAATALGYRPSSTAQNLSSARAGVVGLLLPAHSENLPFSHQLALGALIASEQFRSTIRILSPELVAAGGPIPRLDGCVIVDPVLTDERVGTVLNWGLPSVCVEPAQNEFPSPNAVLTSRHEIAVTELLDHLRDRGAQSIALPLPELGTRWTEDYLRGASAWSARTNTRVTHIPVPAESEAGDPTIAHSIVAIESSFDAAIFVSDRAALAAAFAATAAGRQVGSDFLLASYLDSGYLTAVEPGITAMNLDPSGLGGAAVTLLHEVIESAANQSGAEEMLIRELTPRLVARASTLGA